MRSDGGGYRTLKKKTSLILISQVFLASTMLHKNKSFIESGARTRVRRKILCLGELLQVTELSREEMSRGIKCLQSNLGGGFMRFKRLCA